MTNNYAFSAFRRVMAIFLMASESFTFSRISISSSVCALRTNAAIRLLLIFCFFKKAMVFLSFFGDIKGNPLCSYSSRRRSLDISLLVSILPQWGNVYLPGRILNNILCRCKLGYCASINGCRISLYICELHRNTVYIPCLKTSGPACL